MKIIYVSNIVLMEYYIYNSFCLIKQWLTGKIVVISLS